MILEDLRTKVSPMDSPVAGVTIDFTLTNSRIDKHSNRDLANHMETTGLFQQQDESWSTVKHVFLASGQGSTII